MLDFRANYNTKYGNNQLTNDYLLCPICSNHVDNEESFLQCSGLSNAKTNIQFDDLYSVYMNTVSKSVRHFQKLWKLRKLKLT